MAKYKVTIGKAQSKLTSYMIARGFLPKPIGGQGYVTASRAQLVKAVAVSMPDMWEKWFRTARTKQDKIYALVALAKDLKLIGKEAPTPTQQVVAELRGMREWKEANDADFLRSYEWRRVRMEALKKYGARCQCCGATPKDGARMNVDHIKPRKLFPQLALDITNLQVLCDECNHGKGNWDMTDWRGRDESEIGG